MSAAAPPPASAPSPAQWADGKAAAQGLVDFINRSPSAFHCVQTCIEALERGGYQRLSERDIWALAPLGKYYFTRNGSSIVAFAIGGKYEPKNGVKIIGAHTDSPNLQVKPVSAMERSGCQLVNVAPYGGGLWHTWFDRDLTVAGRVVLRRGDRTETGLVHIPKPILRVPNLCIHFRSGEDREAFKINKEDNIVPLLCTTTAAALEGAPKPADGPGRHHPALLVALAREMGCEWTDIVDFDLSVCDTQPAACQGLYDEFICAPRIDNQASCHCALRALLEAGGLEADPQCRAVALFDNEEVGSESYAGAGGTVAHALLARLLGLTVGDAVGPQVAAAAAANSFALSADCAHAVHPCYASKHADLLRPEMHKGVVLKYDANQRYATNALYAAAVQDIARRHDVPLQSFAIRNDSPCGSTIGPLLATGLGIRTVDLGLPELAMHSIRETCGTTDVLHLYRLLRGFFTDFHTLDLADPDM